MQLNKNIINNMKICLFTIILMLFLGCNDSSLSKQIKMNFSNSLNQHLVMAAFEGKTIESLLEKGGDPNIPYNRSHITPINDAIIFQNYNNLEILVESGADINHQTTFTETPLLECMYSANYKAAVYLLQNGANPTIICKGGYSFLDKVNDSFVGEDTPAYPWNLKVITWLVDNGYQVKGIN